MEEINNHIKRLEKLLKTVKNPTHSKQIEVELTTYRACKLLIDNAKNSC